MKIMGSKELMEQVRNKNLCVVCGACVGLCPYHKAYHGYIANIFDCDLEQGQCYAYCPRTDTDCKALSQLLFDKPYDNSPLGLYRNILSSKAGEKIGEGEFQNGGTVSALAMFALDEGLINAAVLTGTKDGYPQPLLVENSQEVLKCSTTKYMATPTLSVLNEAIKEDYKNFGVVGTGCQMMSVAKMRFNPLEKENYKDAIGLSIGLFCTWSLDTRQFADILSEKMDLESVESMDVPPPPAETFIVKTKSDELQIPLNKIRQLVPEGCKMCPDMTAEWADISVGAFEGKPNWNTLIVRTKKGEQLVQKAVEKGYLKIDDFPQDSLDHLILGADNKRKRAAENLENIR